MNDQQINELVEQIESLPAETQELISTLLDALEAIQETREMNHT